MHVFGKYSVGFYSDPKYGGICLDEIWRKGTWFWFRAEEEDEYSVDNYGLQEEYVDEFKTANN